MGQDAMGQDAMGRDAMGRETMRARVNDYDADEIVRQKKRGERMPAIDKALAGTGLALAALATVFPWYAFLHQDTFALPSLWQGATRDLPEKIGRAEPTLSPVALDARDPATQTAVDDILTATVPAGAPEETPPEEAMGQPFPSANAFRLVHVANGRALIEDGSGMYIVRVGATLPDNSKLATLEQRDGRWALVTSNGDVFQAE